MRTQDRQDKRYDYWLCNIRGIGNRTIHKLLQQFDSAETIYKAKEEEVQRFLQAKQWKDFVLSKENWQVEAEYEMLQRKNIFFVTPDDLLYPERLRHIPDPPWGIFGRGRLPQEQGVSVAIIGARECSEYGRYVAKGLATVLAENGVQIISGMALGIDGISQQAALEAGGDSFGILGCGVDICYPASHQRLYEQLLAKGGVLSVFPPGTPPRAQNFPPRNRIVSGLADVVVVVEARKKSGTLITVDMALEQGKDVYVVPGRITDRLSDGCNELLKQGAGVVLSPYDFLTEIQQRYGMDAGAAAQKIHAGHVLGVSRDVEGGGEAALQKRAVYQALDFYPQSIEEILKKCPDNLQLTAMRANGILIGLCMMQLAEQLMPGYFRLKMDQ